ncbi:TPA: hypothetical protein DCZ31_02550, partial [Patescibacteria group bacterium]|nr:hypothetical protein [Candidatus Gracilibacteria bacterium]
MRISLPVRVFLAVIAGFVGYWLIYAGTPTIAFGFAGIYAILLVLTVMAFILYFPAGIGMIVAFLIYLFVFDPYMSRHIGRSEEFRDLIGQRTVGKFTQDVTPIDPSQIRIVDGEMAKKIGEKLLGEESALGSRAELGEMHVQHVKGKLYWVAPVLHNGYFAWSKFSGGTPGYIKVSATNPNDFEFVRKINGQEIHIKYQPNGWFGDNLERHLWLNGYMSKGITDFTFEIDDEGKPYYVITVYARKIGWAGSDTVGVAVVDVQTGDIQPFTPEKAPAWIDRIQPSDIVYTQLGWWGDYQDGWFNPSGNKKLKPTHDALFVHGTDGHGYWYTGISSKGNEGSISGFAMVDSRTKEFRYYEVAGTTEDAAQKSVLGKVKSMNYQASYPILYNVGGRPTYVMSLKDDAGLVKMIGMADVGDHSVVGVGDTVQDALRNYASAQNSKGNAVLLDDKIKAKKITGKIGRAARDDRGGNTYYHLAIASEQGKIFVGDSNLSQELITTQVGDTVEVEFA